MNMFGLVVDKFANSIIRYTFEKNYFREYRILDIYVSKNTIKN